MISWEDEYAGNWGAYLGTQRVASVWSDDDDHSWTPVGIIANGCHYYDQNACESFEEARQAVEDYVRAWLQDAGLVSAPWLRASVDAYWEKRGGSPRVDA